MKITAEGTEISEEELYQGWLLAGKLAEWLGMKVGMMTEQFIPDTVTLFIELPSGTTAIDIPLAFAEGNWKYLDHVPDISAGECYKAVQDCLNGYLVNKHMLVIPEKKEEIE